MRDDTYIDRLPDYDGWEVVQDWPERADELREKIGIKDEPNTERLIIFGESGTGKTRAMRDTFLSNLEEGQEDVNECDRKYIRAPIWTADTLNAWLKTDEHQRACALDPLECFMKVQDPEYYPKWAMDTWDKLRYCAECKCLYYWPSKYMPLGIDDLQNFTSKKQLLVLRNVFEYWPTVAVTIQTPRGFQPESDLENLQDWLVERLKLKP